MHSGLNSRCIMKPLTLSHISCCMWPGISVLSSFLQLFSSHTQKSTTTVILQPKSRAHNLHNAQYELATTLHRLFYSDVETPVCGLGWCWQSCAAKLWASPAPVWASVLSVPTYSLHCAVMWRFRPELEDCWIASHYTVTPPSCMMTTAAITIVFPCPDIVSALGSCSISSHGQFPKYHKQVKMCNEDDL